MKKQIILLIICVLVILILGYGAVVFYKAQQASLQASAMVKMLSSKLISPIMAFGEVKDVSSDGNITLSYNGNTIVVKTKDGAKILAVQNGPQKEVKLQDLKVGDFVNITLNITQNYTIEGSRVLIIPSAKTNP